MPMMTIGIGPTLVESPSKDTNLPELNFQIMFTNIILLWYHIIISLCISFLAKHFIRDVYIYRLVKYFLFIKIYKHCRLTVLKYLHDGATTGHCMMFNFYQRFISAARKFGFWNINIKLGRSERINPEKSKMDSQNTANRVLDWPTFFRTGFSWNSAPENYFYFL